MILEVKVINQKLKRIKVTINVFLLLFGLLVFISLLFFSFSSDFTGYLLIACLFILVLVLILITLYELTIRIGYDSIKIISFLSLIDEFKKFIPNEEIINIVLNINEKDFKKSHIINKYNNYIITNKNKIEFLILKSDQLELINEPKIIFKEYKSIIHNSTKKLAKNLLHALAMT